jgi:hypothetical protein
MKKRPASIEEVRAAEKKVREVLDALKKAGAQDPNHLSTELKNATEFPAEIGAHNKHFPRPVQARGIGRASNLAIAIHAVPPCRTCRERGANATQEEPSWPSAYSVAGTSLAEALRLRRSLRAD